MNNDNAMRAWELDHAWMGDIMPDHSTEQAQGAKDRFYIALTLQAIAGIAMAAENDVRHTLDDDHFEDDAKHAWYAIVSRGADVERIAQLCDRLRDDLQKLETRYRQA